MKKDIITITILGPESTGKSTLCEGLAKHYNTSWCPEYARGYLLTNGSDYDYDDLLLIAKGQLEQEERCRQVVIETSNAGHGKPILFVDTDMYVMKVWSEFVFGKVDPLILEAIPRQQTDLYLLCDIDLPWVKDELREYPDLERRQQLYNIYFELMMNQPIPFEVIRGSNEDRLHSAISIVDLFLASHS